MPHAGQAGGNSAAAVQDGGMSEASHVGGPISGSSSPASDQDAPSRSGVEHIARRTSSVTLRMPSAVEGRGGGVPPPSLSQQSMASGEALVVARGGAALDRELPPDDVDIEDDAERSPVGKINSCGTPSPSVWRNRSSFRRRRAFPDVLPPAAFSFPATFALTAAVPLPAGRPEGTRVKAFARGEVGCS